MGYREELHLELVRDFAAIGYDSYRLVPGLDLLIPFDAATVQDGYLLNLFCCKQDRAERLAARGFLLNPTSQLPANAPQGIKLREKVKTHGEYNWRNTVAKLPYERLRSFSSFYTGPSARPLLETIRALGFASPEMQRRLELLKKRFRMP